MGERESVALATKSDGLFYSNGVLIFKQLVFLQVWVLTMISNDAIQVSSKASYRAVCTPVYKCEMRQKQWNSSRIYKFKERERDP